MTVPKARPVPDWTVTPATALDHPAIADFLATTEGLGGRKFAADSRDVAEHLDGTYDDAVELIRDETGAVRGYSALHRPSGAEPEVSAAFAFDPAVPPHVVDGVVGRAVERSARETRDTPDAYLRAFLGRDQQSAIDALVHRGAVREGDFIRTRRPVRDEERAAFEAASLPGVTVLSWPEVVARNLTEDVRRLQYDTFLEHFGNLSKSPEAFEHHLRSRSFTPDFSLAAVDGGDVVGYVLGSTFTAGSAGSGERSAHTDYIGVHRDHRRRGIAELLLTRIWLAALRRGLAAASLGTDVNNRSNAHLLYRRLGYVAIEHQSAYRIDGIAAR